MATVMQATFMMPEAVFLLVQLMLVITGSASHVGFPVQHILLIQQTHLTLVQLRAGEISGAYLRNAPAQALHERISTCSAARRGTAAAARQALPALPDGLQQLSQHLGGCLTQQAFGHEGQQRQQRRKGRLGAAVTAMPAQRQLFSCCCVC